MSEDKKYIVKGSVINILGMVTNAISPALVILMARFFSQEEFGLFITLQLFVLTASRFFVMSLDKGVLWYIPQNQAHQREENEGLFPAINTSLLLALGGACLGAVFIYGGGLHWLDELRKLPKMVVLICFANIVPFMLLHIGSSAFQGVRRPEIKIIINQFFVNSLFPLFAIVGYYLNLNMYSLAFGYSLANCIGAVWYIFLIQKRFGRWSFSFTIPDRLLKYSLPLVFADVIAGLLLRVDVWFVLALLGPQQSAVYSVIVILSNGVKMIRQSFDSVLLAVISKMNRQNVKDQLRETFSYSINFITSLQIAIAITILFFPQEIMSIAGKGYTSSPIVLSILLLGNLLNGFWGANGLILLGIGKSNLILLLNVISLLVNLCGNYFLIPRIGLPGAAISTVVAFMVQNGLAFIFVYVIAKKHFYQKHLILNLALILGFAYTVFSWFEEIQAQDPWSRVIMWFSTIVIVGGMFLLKRDRFTLK